MCSESRSAGRLRSGKDESPICHPADARLGEVNDGRLRLDDGFGGDQVPHSELVAVGRRNHVGAHLGVEDPDGAVGVE